jgi:hypothetical protein
MQGRSITENQQGIEDNLSSMLQCLRFFLINTNCVAISLDFIPNVEMKWLLILLKGTSSKGLHVMLYMEKFKQ